MPETSPGSQTPNDRFDALWDEVGAKRIVLGDADEGVEIRVDADLSIFGILEKLKQAAERGHEEGAISTEERQKVSDALEETLQRISGGLHDRLRDQFRKITGKGE